MVRCKSGMHEWIREEDAQKCCNGFERVIVLYPKPEDVDKFCGWYGYKWVAKDQDNGKM